MCIDIMKQKCHWEKCKTKIEVKQMSDNPMFQTVGWCEVHQLAFRIYHDLEKKYCKDHKLSWPVGSLTYKNHKKAFNGLHDLAGHRAEQEIKYATSKMW